MKTRPTNDAVRGLLWWVPGCLVFFRYAFKSGFDNLMGDPGDARLAVFLHEHWVQVARGHVSWTSPQIFFPTKGTLGSSDTFLLDEVFYFPLRALGMDQFLAFQWTLILLSLVGFVSLFVFLRRTLELGAPTCAALTTTFAFANNLYIKTGHVQLYGVYWLPLLLLLVLQATQARDRKRRIAWGAASGALLGLLFYSTYYIAWFAVLGATGVAVLLLVWRLATRGWKAVATLLRPHVVAAVGAAAGFGLAMIPFAITYLPVLREQGGRTYEEVMFFAPWPSDMINVGPSNYLWGSAMRGLLKLERLGNGEVSLALTPILMLAVIASCVIVLIRRRRVAVGFAGEVCVASTITLACLIVLPVKFGSGSLWRIPYDYFPGAQAMRALDRLVLVGGLLAVIIIGIAIRSVRGTTAAERPHRRIEVGAIAVLLCLIVVEQLNLGRASRIDRSEELKALIVAPAPPAACQAFYILDTSPTPELFYVSTIDAMLLAQHFGIPTLNGYSGKLPVGYDLLDTVSPDYVARVNVWAEAHGVSAGLCSYDRFTAEWSGPEV